MEFFHSIHTGSQTPILAHSEEPRSENELQKSERKIKSSFYAGSANITGYEVMENRRKVRRLGQRMCSSVGRREVRVFLGVGAPGVQICVLVCTQAPFRHTLAKSLNLLWCTHRRKVRKGEVFIHLFNTFIH